MPCPLNFLNCYCLIFVNNSIYRLIGFKTMEIHLQLYSILRDKLPPEAKGRTVLELKDGAVLADILNEFDITKRVVISVNDKHITDDSFQLQNGDQVKIFTSIGGG